MGLAIIAGFLLSVVVWGGVRSFGLISGQIVVDGFEKPTEIFDEDLDKPFVFKDGEKFSSKKLDLSNYKKVNMIVTSGRVILSTECSKLSITTTAEKTERLTKSVEVEYGVRPEEYDLIEEILDVFDIKVEYMAIDGLVDDVFYSHIVFSDGESILNLDAKPSDALAITSRFKAPIYVREDMIANYAETTC